MLLSMTEFIYNNAKKISKGYTSFELNYGYHPRISFKENVNPCSKSKTANKLTKELRNLIAA